LPEKLPENVTEESSEKSSEKILHIINNNNQVTIDELSKSLNMTTRAIEKNISKLKSRGILERVGPDRGGYWKINN
jgi:ATP-dependent DNA helicase RecG